MTKKVRKDKMKKLVEVVPYTSGVVSLLILGYAGYLVVVNGLSLLEQSHIMISGFSFFVIMLGLIGWEIYERKFVGAIRCILLILTVLSLYIMYSTHLATYVPNDSSIIPFVSLVLGMITALLVRQERHLGVIILFSTLAGFSMWLASGDYVHSIIVTAPFIASLILGMLSRSATRLI